MANIRSERRRAPGADMAAYLRDAAPDNSAQLRQLKRALRHALSTVVTPRQRELLLLYYGQGLNMRQIGERLGLDKSSVCRPLKRGEARLRRCLRYGLPRQGAPHGIFSPDQDR